MKIGNQDYTKSIIFVFTGYGVHDEGILVSTASGKMFYASAKYGNAKALIYHHQKNNIPNNENIIYLKGNPALERKQPITSLAQIFSICKWLRQHRPALVVLSGAPAKLDIRFLYRLLAPKQKFAILMATPSVDQRKWLRTLQNRILQINLMLFNNLMVPRAWRHDRLRLPKRKLRYYELGFNDFGFAAKDLSTLKLVYLGVFGGREIERTIEGLAIFLSKNKDAKVTYEIAGKNKPQEAESIKNAIKKHKLESIVRFHGFLSQEEAAKLIQDSNIGVSYIPINEIYGYASTKTIEYLIAGLPVIATQSKFREEYINESNGILHQDNALAFAEALEYVYYRRLEYKPEEIRKSILHLSNEQKVKNSFLPLLESLITKKGVMR